MAEKLFVNFFIDCEATQPAVNDISLGERSSRGFADVLEAHGLRGTYHVIPSDLEASPAVYRELATRGHEIGLHVHPAADGYEEFLGVYGSHQQHEILSRAVERFADVMGSSPRTFCPGYGSSNDHTYGVLYDLGFRHGMTGIPTRVLPECASVHAGAPLDIHYANRHNRVLVGDLDFVEIPLTIDPDSRLWGGKHPLDLRVELVDAKNHWYTIKKAVDRQVAGRVPVKVVRGLTHNTFDYSDPRDFRRQTLNQMIHHIRSIAAAAGLDWVAGTADQIAETYRASVPVGSTTTELKLDRRGYAKPSATQREGSLS